MSITSSQHPGSGRSADRTVTLVLAATGWVILTTVAVLLATGTWSIGAGRVNRPAQTEKPDQTPTTDQTPTPDQTATTDQTPTPGRSPASDSDRGARRAPVPPQRTGPADAPTGPGGTGGTGGPGGTGPKTSSGLVYAGSGRALIPRQPTAADR